MERYRILGHTADGKFRAFGDTLEEAFANAALATASLMWDWTKVFRRVEHAIEVLGRDEEQLLYKFIEETLYLFESRKFLLAAVEDLRIENPIEIVPLPLPADPGPEPVSADDPAAFRLTARFLGDDRPDLYEFHGDVKAVTYDEMKIGSCDGIAWVVQVVVDM